MLLAIYGVVALLVFFVIAFDAIDHDSPFARRKEAVSAGLVVGFLWPILLAVVAGFVMWSYIYQWLTK